MSTKAELTRLAADVASSPKVAPLVSTAAIGSGVSTFFDLLSKGVGIAASIAGFVLAITLYRKAALELEILRSRERERIEQTEDRRDHNEPLRREDDSICVTDENQA